MVIMLTILNIVTKRRDADMGVTAHMGVDYVT